MSGEDIVMSPSELETAKNQAVQESKMDNLEALIPQILAALKSLEKNQSRMPMQIRECKDEIEAKQKAYSHENFITERELNLFEIKLESKVTTEIASLTTVVLKAKWVLSSLLIVATVANYLITNTTFFHN